MLQCDECACVSRHGPGWVAYLADDPDCEEPAAVVIVCPPCAAREFGYAQRVPYT